MEKSSNIYLEMFPYPAAHFNIGRTFIIIHYNFSRAFIISQSEGGLKSSQI